VVFIKDKEVRKRLTLFFLKKRHELGRSYFFASAVGLDARGHTVTLASLNRWKKLFSQKKNESSPRSVLLDISANYFVESDPTLVPLLKTLDVLRALSSIIEDERIEIGRFPITSFETAGFYLNRYHYNPEKGKRPLFRKFDFYYPFVKAVGKLVRAPTKTTIVDCYCSARLVQSYLSQQKSFDTERLTLLREISENELCARFEITCEANFAVDNLKFLELLQDSITAAPISFQEYFTQIEQSLKTIDRLRSEELRQPSSAQLLLKLKALEQVSLAVFSGNFRMLSISPLGRDFVHKTRINQYFNEKMIRKLLEIEAKGNFLSLRGLSSKATDSSIQRTILEFTNLHSRIMVCLFFSHQDIGLNKSMKQNIFLYRVRLCTSDLQRLEASLCVFMSKSSLNKNREKEIW